MRLMGTGELEHVNSETKHSSTQQKPLSPSCVVITEVALIREDVQRLFSRTIRVQDDNVAVSAA